MNPLYEHALKLSENRAATASAIADVARQTSPDAAQWAFSQWSLRKRGAAKFERAALMYFDREGMEMATHEAVAAYHASLFPPGELVLDLTVGLGADLIALAQRGPASGFELDATRAEYAMHNLAVYGVAAGIDVASSTDASSVYIYADPSRREGGKRTLDPTQFSPNPEKIMAEHKDAKLIVTKLSPMLPDLFLEALAPRLEFISFQGECREALVIGGSDAEPGRFAVQVETGERLGTSYDPTPQDEPDAYLHEADPAAIRAHTLGTLADRHGLRGLGDSNGYLTGPAPLESPWLRSYKVLYHGPADLKKTKAELVRLGAATPVIKQRGVNQDIEALRKQLKQPGTNPVVLILFPVGKSVRHILATL